MRTGTVVRFHLFHGKNPATQITDPGEFLLDYLQPFMPLAMSDLRLGSMPLAPSVFLIQFLNVYDLGTETRNLFAKHFQVIHTIRIPYLATPRAVINAFWPSRLKP
jgi:hypothetical protein